MGLHRDKILTAVSVRNLRAPGRYPDGGGLYLVVSRTGAKKWVLRTVVHGRRCDIGLGGARITSLAEAREAATQLRKIARTGGDPIAVRRQEKTTAPTFQQAADSVHNEHAKAWKNPKHRDQWINTLKEHVFPIFGSKAVNTVDSADVLKALSPIWLARPETARRIRQRIRVVFDWAKASGHRAGDNPVDGVAKVLPKQPSARVHHAALAYSEVPGFVLELRKSNTTLAVKLAFEFLILTATRTNEVLGAQWSEIDLAACTWTIPKDRMKAKREHRVPLSPRCIEILREARSLPDGGIFVFPGRPQGPMQRALSNMSFLMALRRMDRDNITAHGFRSSFRDFAAEQTGFPPAVCEAALAHTVRNKAEAAYNRTDLFDKRRQLMDEWEAFVVMHPNQFTK